MAVQRRSATKARVTGMYALKQKQAAERERLFERQQAERDAEVRREEAVGGPAGRIQDSVTNILHRDNNPYAGKTSTRRYGIDKIKSKE